MSWQGIRTDADCDALGRYAAALALPLLDTDAARSIAAAHCLCSHMTSLVLVDEVGEATNMLPEMRKIPLMAPKRSQMSYDRSIDHCKSGSVKSNRIIDGSRSPSGSLLIIVLIPALILVAPFIILWKIPTLLRQIWQFVQDLFKGREKFLNK